jgi:hypothetical protein
MSVAFQAMLTWNTIMISISFQISILAVRSRTDEETKRRTSVSPSDIVRAGRSRERTADQPWGFKRIILAPFHLDISFQSQTFLALSNFFFSTLRQGQPYLNFCRSIAQVSSSLDSVFLETRGGSDGSAAYF